MSQTILTETLKEIESISQRLYIDANRLNQNTNDPDYAPEFKIQLAKEYLAYCKVWIEKIEVALKLEALRTQYRASLESPLDREDLTCPHCDCTHKDINEWALRPHQTHRCWNCCKTFEGTKKAVSHPTLTTDFISQMEGIDND